MWLAHTPPPTTRVRAADEFAHLVCFVFSSFRIIRSYHIADVYAFFKLIIKPGWALNKFNEVDRVFELLAEFIPKCV